MRLRTFRAATMTEALDQIRKELGIDAVIVSSQQDNTGFQITAALETPAPDLTPPYEPKKQQLQSPLELIDLLCRCFDYHIVPNEVGESLLARLKVITEGQSQGSYDAEGVIAELLPHKPIDYHVPEMIALVGLSGAGKSMTAAKIASEYVLAGLHPTLVTTDGLKAGAKEQLQAYAGALKIPFESFDHFEGLIKFVKSWSYEQPLIIDTPGMNLLNIEENLEFQGLFETLNISPTFVCAAGQDCYEFLDKRDLLYQLGIERFILTKCDTVRRFGTLLTAMAENKMSLTAFGRGPELGNRLRPASSTQILQLLTDPLKMPFEALKSQIRKEVAR